MHTNKRMNPCYHVMESGRALCGVRRPFWQAVANGSGEIYNDETVCSTGTYPLPSSMVCGRCERILRSRNASA